MKIEKADTKSPTLDGQTKDFEALLKVKEVAERLRLSPSTVYNFADRGLLPSVRMGKAVRFSPRDVTAAIEKMKLKAYGKVA